MQTAELQISVVFPGEEPLLFPFPHLHIQDDQKFFEFCNDNVSSNLRFERESDGEVRLIPPSGSDTGKVNGYILTRLSVWNESMGEPGYVFDSSAGFKLPNGAVRAPDVCYIVRERYDALSEFDRQHHAPIAPDFAIEVMSPTDRLKALQDKMKEYVANGVRLGWLIDRKQRKVYVYRPERKAESLTDPNAISADPELTGFVLAMDRIF